MSYSDPTDEGPRITARFFVDSIVEHGRFDQISVTLMPAYSEGQNKEWAKATPSGKIELSVDSNLPAANFFRGLLRDKEKNIAVEFYAVAKGD